MNPVAELRAFFRATLVDPVPRDHTEPDSAFRRRRVVAAVTLLVGAGVLAWALRIEPGNAPLLRRHASRSPRSGSVGAFASGPLHLGRAHTRDGDGQSRAVAAVARARRDAARPVPPRRGPRRPGPVSCATRSSSSSTTPSTARSPVVALITGVNGIAEELYFRGALYAGVGRRHALAVTTVVYALVTASSGIPLLVLAAAVVGLVVGLQRRVTGGILGPTVTHLTWSLGMLFLLPPVLDRFS